MKFYLFIILGLFSLSAHAQSGKITVTVSGFNNDKGLCQACLFNKAEEFREGGKAIKCISAFIKEKRSFFSFENVPTGEYAILLFHDVNRNNQLDKNFLGIPKEGYGASGNALPFASAPSFGANRFQVMNENIVLKIRIRNL